MVSDNRAELLLHDRQDVLQDVPRLQHPHPRYLRLTCPICDRYLCVLQVCSGSCKTTAVVVVVFDSVIHRYPVKAFYSK